MGSEVFHKELLRKVAVNDFLQSPLCQLSERLHPGRIPAPS